MKNIKKVTLLGHYNQYSSKLYFAKKFTEALERNGVEVLNLDLTASDADEENVFQMINFKADCTLSFNTSIPDKSGKHVFEYFKKPHLHILVDPPIYYLEDTKSPYSVYSTVDELDLQWLKDKGVDKAFFLPHAIERELVVDPLVERPFDVTFIGSCYDLERMMDLARTLFTPDLMEAIDISIKRYEIELSTPFEVIIEEEIEKKQLKLSHKIMLLAVRVVDNYVRGKERFDLIKSITSVPVHIFGEAGDQRGYHSRSWEELLADQKNLVFHPAVNYDESIEILKKSKISLNSMPFFRKGTHERIFASLACGSALITSNNLWIEEHFENGKDLIAYDIGNYEGLDKKVLEILNDDKLRKKMVLSGQKKVLKDHTWDNRAETFLNFMNSLT